jgi:hypothetical protein
MDGAELAEGRINGVGMGNEGEGGGVEGGEGGGEVHGGFVGIMKVSLWQTDATTNSVQESSHA